MTRFWATFVFLLPLTAAASLPASLLRGDEALLRIEYPIALAEYESALRESGPEPEILWRLSRVYVLMSEVAEGVQREQYLRLGEESARQCIALDSTKAGGHTWLAATLGYQALTARTSDQIWLAREILYEADRALLLNPQDDVAYSVKGSTYRALGNVGWLKKGLAQLFLGDVPEGGYREAEEALKRAVELAPQVMRHQYELAVLYLDMGRKEETVILLRRAVQLPIRIGSDRERRDTIQRLLSQDLQQGSD